MVTILPTYAQGINQIESKDLSQIVSSKGGTFVTGLLAKVVFHLKYHGTLDADDQTINAFMKEVIKVERYITTGALSASAAFAIGLLCGHSFIAFLAFSPLLVAVTAISIYTLKKSPEIADSQVVIQQHIVLGLPSNEQANQLNDCRSYLLGLNKQIIVTDNWFVDLNYNYDAVLTYWGQLSFNELVAQEGYIPPSLVQKYKEIVKEHCDKIATEIQETEFWGLAIMDVNFEQLQGQNAYLTLLYTTRVSSGYNNRDSSEIHEGMNTLMYVKAEPVNAYFLKLIYNPQLLNQQQ